MQPIITEATLKTPRGEALLAQRRPHTTDSNEETVLSSVPRQRSIPPRGQDSAHEGAVHVSFSPDDKGSPWRFLKFMGPAFMVSIGYMDPGNWATDIEGGSRFGYQLVWVLFVSNVMAILLQTMAARLGQVTELHLAQLCRQEYPPRLCWTLWILAELAIAATDLAEVIGTAVGLNLITGIPLIAGVLITASDTILFLAIQNFGMRKLEAVILVLLSVVSGCFVCEIFLSRPDPKAVLAGFIPRVNGESIFVAIGILGATVMPHNFYLHSAAVQSRSFERTEHNIRRANFYVLLDSVIALNIAFLVNLSILMVSAANFYGKETVTTLQQAHALLETVLDSKVAPFAFGVALLCAGQSSTITGTLAGQYVMEGFVSMQIRPWIRRLLTRMVAVTPAVIIIILLGDGGIYQLLLASQTILSLQLPFAVIPLIKFSSSSRLMGPFANPGWVKFLSWLSAVFIIVLNLYFIVDLIEDFLRFSLVLALMGVVLFILVLVLLIWVLFAKEPSAEVSRRQYMPLAAELEDEDSLVLEPTAELQLDEMH